ncbi:MAG TPA: hypothetical protein VMT37_11470 [Solirubrobacterales bacterium]|nr:hypothetical protein [Solirubrobacterales bacterium]
MFPINTPEWEPLLDLAPDHVDDFMWMYAAELEDGTRIQAYKHYWTRRYVFLDGNGRAYAYVDRERYEERDATWLLAQALVEDTLHNEWYPFVGHNDPEDIEISWTRSATKHRISRARSGYVAQRCGLRYSHRSRQGPLGWEDDRVLFLGDDDEGLPLEVVAVELAEEVFRVIHAMPVRRKHIGLYRRARRWQR